MWANVPFLCQNMLFVQGLCACACTRMRVSMLTSSVLRDSPSATYGCFYRECINQDVAVNINVSPEGFHVPLPECR